LASKANLVVIAEHVATEGTGRNTGPVGLVRLSEFTSDFRVLAILKEDGEQILKPGKHLSLRHYRPDWRAWQQENPPKAGSPPPGLINGVSALVFGDEKGPYLLFVARVAGGVYEPVSSQSPTDSILLLRQVGRGSSLPPIYDVPAGS
jgi:hypothetical protein